MTSDFFTILYWWLVLFGLGVLSLPLAFKLFEKFWDKGWVFSKTLSIAIISYLVFLLGRIHLLPFFRETIFLIIFLVLGINFWQLRQGKKLREFQQIIKKNWRRFLVEEIIFLLGLVFWAFVRGFQPNIEGLEKFMDFGFVNSILRSKWFPPQDMWFAGESINYYYFGHLQAAVLTKLSGLDSAITYNLMMATVFTFTFTSSFSLVSNLIGVMSRDRKLKVILVGGLVSAFLLTLGGNLHPAIYALKDGPKKYWYPDATRFIGYRPNNPDDKTIHEFPLYSFVVADLHGHMNDIPTVLLFLAVLLVIGLYSEKKKKKFKLRNPGLGILSAAFLLGIMYMTNSWDFVIYGALYALFTLFLAIKNYPGDAKKALRKWLLTGVLVLLGAIVFSLPFSISFKPIAQGIAFVRARSLWWQLLVLWGFFWFVSFGFWFYLAKRTRKKPGAILLSDLFVFSATLWATVLIIIPEIIYVKDIYIPEYHRANTMFKLVYQSFMIYSLAAGYIFVRIKSAQKISSVFRWLFIFIFLIGFSAQMVYPSLAIKGYYGKLTLNRYQGIYGMKFLEKQHPDDYRGVIWLKENVVGQPVVLEAVGDSYTLYNRVSAMTGLPTIEGWLVHEWLWRGGYDKPGARATEVGAIYQGEDEDRAEQILKQYQVQYVFVGSLEREKYSNLDESRFARWGEIVFSSGETKIYHLQDF